MHVRGIERQECADEQVAVDEMNLVPECRGRRPRGLSREANEFDLGDWFVPRPGPEREPARGGEFELAGNTDPVAADRLVGTGGNGGRRQREGGAGHGGATV